MKLRTFVDAIGVAAAIAAVVEQAHHMLAPHLPSVGGIVPKTVRDLPTRVGNAYSAFTGPIEAPRAYKPRAATPRPRRTPANDAGHRPGHSNGAARPMAARA